MERHRDEKLHEQALERFKEMTPEERAQLLKRAGILDAEGHLAERYRPPDATPQTQQRQATDPGR